MQIVNRWAFPFLVLFAVFSEQIYYSYLSFRGILAESGQLQYLFIGISLISYCILLWDLSRVNSKSHMYRVISVLIGVLFLYFFSSVLQGDVPKLYYSQLLRYGSISISCAILGMHLANNQYYLTYIDRLLPLFIIPVSLIIGSVGLNYAAIEQIVRDDSGLNYQILSYYMAEFYAYSAYYIFFSSAKDTKINTILKPIMLGIMFFCAIICVMSGGRGAMVFIIAVTFFLIYMMVKARKMSIIKVLFIILIIGVAFSIVASELNVWDSVGFNRVLNRMMNDEGRARLREAALSTFSDSPLFGKGLGSIWWTVGFYSHNMFLDLLAESGIIGTLIVTYVLIKIIINLIKLCKLNQSYIFLMLIFLKTLTMTMFSGYWIASFQLWLIFGFIFVQDLKNPQIILREEVCG